MTNLRTKVGELLRLVGEETGEEVLFVELCDEDFDTHGRPSITADRLRRIDEFSLRFGELLSVGYAWVNLSLLGHYKRWKVVGVELPREPAGADLTAVNLSGQTSLALKIQGEFADTR